MSIKTNAEQIRDETGAGANTATRVGGNLVEVADDLVAKQTLIDANTAKTGITTAQANEITANNAKTGITTAQANEIIDNNAKVTYDAAAAVAANTAKVSFDSASSTRLADTSNTNTGDQDLSVVLHTTSTGLSQGGTLVIDTDTSKFKVNAGFGYIVNGHSDVENPTSSKITWSTSAATSAQFLATHNASYVAIDINGDIFQTSEPLTATQRRNYIRIGLLVHPNRTSIFIVNDQPTLNVELGGQVQDVLNLIGFVSKSGNRVLPAAATGMTLKKEAGVAFKAGANFNTLATQPHSFILPAQTPITFRYRTQDGTEGSDITAINPQIYDLNGTITAIPATATLASVQQIYIFQEGDVRIQPGQVYYNNLNEAVLAINSGAFVTEENIENNGLYLGSIAMIYGTTNLSTIAQAIFIPSRGTTTNGSIATTPIGYTPEDTANKQNSLTADGTGVKYATVDAINAFKSGIKFVDGTDTADAVFTGGNAGIGTTTPAAKLDIVGVDQTGSDAEGVLNLAQTWNTTGSPTAIKLDVTDTASNAASKLIDLQVDSTSVFKVTKGGDATADKIEGTGYFGLVSTVGRIKLGSGGSESIITNTSDGVIRFVNRLENNFSRLQLGGVSSSFPSIKRNGAGIDIRLADDSDYAPIAASTGTFSGDTINVATIKTPASSTATGTKGDIAWDVDYIYVCTATDTWKRTAISTW